MARADVLQLVSDLALSQSDATEVGVLYDEVVRELGFYEFLTGTEQIAVSANAAAYKVATDTIRILEVIDSTVGRLDRVDGRSLRSVFGAGWRNKVGTPIAHTATEASSDTIQLVPIPQQPSTLTVIRTEARTDVPVWLELAIALEIVHREFLRESNHQDIAYAQTARDLANMLLAMLGLQIRNARQREPEEA